MSPFPVALTLQPLAIVVALLLTAMFVVTMGVVAWSYDLRRARLPAATRMEGLQQRNEMLAGQIVDKEAELNEIKRQIAERDRIGAEVAALKEQLDAVRLELSGLDEGRRQIDEVKRKAAEAATEYGEAAEKRDEARRELAELEERVARLNTEQNKVTHLLAELEAKQAEREALQKELAALREEHTKIRTDLNAAQELIAKSNVLREDIEQLQRQKEQAGAAAAEADRRRIEMQRTLDALQPALIDARRLAANLPELEARRAALDVHIKELEGKAKQLGAPSGSAADGSLVNPLADLMIMPACLSALSGADRIAEKETDAVEDVCQRLEKLGLRYSRRVVRAFHTALKINETAQMTVLAGVSGTGKSLLPRRYAEAMGISFLQIAVEPRWDGPQDLLGFYNYVEQRYRATELARALVRMDPYNTSGLAKAPLDDRMLLVLLDEMNLARVEYYFSEFLSRLEVRPPYAEVRDEAKRRDASMPIDIRGRKEGPIHLFPSYNVLFTGTMNDDESTQALSDKVLDRGNVMQFAAPQSFAQNAVADPPKLMEGYRRFSEWRRWVKAIKDLDNSDRAKADEIIGKLARIMERFGRPFGHRLNEAMLAYVANYPRSPSESVNEPLADQIEFRILPKLRGVAIEEAPAEFEELRKLIGEELRDDMFAGRLAELMDRQQRGTGQFNWRGLDRL